MINYESIEQVVKETSPAAPNWNPVVSRLLGLWLDDYRRRHPSSDVVEVPSNGFFYLFDVGSERLLAAWGESRGRDGHVRDAGRMAGHPLSAGGKYHRGHAIPHRMGGGTDINLVAQLGKINVGPFRPLERRAVATPGSLYFTYWKYFDATSQLARGVDQGLCIGGQPLAIREHGN